MNGAEEMVAPGYGDRKVLVQSRLRRFEDQVEGLQNMILYDRQFIDEDEQRDKNPGREDHFAMR